MQSGLGRDSNMAGTPDKSQTLEGKPSPDVARVQTIILYAVAESANLCHISSLSTTTPPFPDSHHQSALLPTEHEIYH